MGLSSWGGIRSSMARAVPRVIAREEIKYDEMSFRWWIKRGSCRIK
jgi:hypothetical protein